MVGAGTLGAGSGRCWQLLARSSSASADLLPFSLSLSLSLSLRGGASGSERVDPLVIMIWPHQTHFRMPSSPLQVSKAVRKTVIKAVVKQ